VAQAQQIGFMRYQVGREKLFAGIVIAEGNPVTVPAPPRKNAYLRHFVGGQIRHRRKSIQISESFLPRVIISRLPFNYASIVSCI
jgi:hypothetical protein